MTEVFAPWRRAQKIEVTRSRAYKKNDQAFVEQKSGAGVRRLVGYGRFNGIQTAEVTARCYAAARLPTRRCRKRSNAGCARRIAVVIRSRCFPKSEAVKRSSATGLAGVEPLSRLPRRHRLRRVSLRNRLAL
jgi:hypothetical protein